jgi:hypothetical protein
MESKGEEREGRCQVAGKRPARLAAVQGTVRVKGVLELGNDDSAVIAAEHLEVIKK